MSIHHIKVIGRVQGIGYRRWAEHQASELGLSGWVRNSSDGSVEIMVQGENNLVNLFLEKCLKGPSFAYVLGIKPVAIPTATPPPIQEGVFKIIASA